MPRHPWRFAPGDIAFSHPCLPEHRVTILAQVPHRSPQGILCPHYRVRDAADAEFIVSQLRLSSCATSARKNGEYKLLRGAVK